MIRVSFCFLIICLVCSVSACAPRPKLLPNAKLNKVSPATAKRDVNACLNQAKYETEGYQIAAAKDARASMASSAAASASSGLVSGATSVGGVNFSGSATRGVRDAVKDVLSDRSSDPAFRRSVEACLRKKGYRISDWG